MVLLASRRAKRFPDINPDGPVHYYCDEAGTSDQDAWFAVGGVGLAQSEVPTIEEHLQSIKTAEGAKGEVKWQNANKRSGRVHATFMEYLFQLVREGKAEIHVRFAEMAAFDHKSSGEREKIDTISHSYYELLEWRATHYYAGRDLHIFPDDGDCTARLVEFINPLRAFESRKWLKGGQSRIAEIQPLSSSDNLCLQMLDVTLGALTAARNERHLRPEAGEIKSRLAARATQLMTKGGPLTETMKWVFRGRNIWNSIPNEDKATMRDRRLRGELRW